MNGRLWPQGWRMRVAVGLALAAAVAYIAVTFWQRNHAMFDRWTADGDQAQAVWQYWRYHKEGALPPGDLLTDYAFIMHAPPVWWLLMATLSTFIEPVTAAKVLHVLAYALTPAMAYVVVARRAHPFAGVAAMLLVARSYDFSGIIAGGYARSFGGFLTLLFLWAFLERRHYAALAILVFQAAFYPSVVIPCGLAYGIYVVVAGPTMQRRVRRMAGMFVAGLLIIAMGKLQDLRAPDWWGPLVTEKEAMTMPSWGPGGRITEAPLKPMSFELPRNLTRAFRPTGPALSPTASRVFFRNPGKALLALGALIGVSVLLSWLWRRRRGLPADPALTKFPWELLLVFACAFASYLLARALAFKLYLPYRTIQHTWPYLMYVGLPLVVFYAVERWLPTRRTLVAIITAVFWIVTMWAVAGHGVIEMRQTYATYAGGKRLFEFIRKLPNGVVLAGDLVSTSSIPMFGGHSVYVNKNLTHPFRKGYYEECERRILRTYQTLYASSFDDLIRFGKEENIRYLVYRRNAFKSRDSRLFQPVRRQIDRLYQQRRRANAFVLEKPPKQAVVFSDRLSIVVDITKLPTTPPAKPMVEGAAPAPAPAAAPVDDDAPEPDTHDDARGDDDAPEPRDGNDDTDSFD